MRPATVRALRAIDRRFYQRHADGFAGSRRLPWEGWRQALDESLNRRQRLRVLDAGCAHGRLADYLGSHREMGFDYLGVDSALALLAQGRGRTQAAWPSASGDQRIHFVAADLLGTLPIAPADAGFDLIALFGVLHHIPGQDSRRRLLARLGAHLAPHGRLVITAWRVERQPGFADKRIPWQRYNETAEEPIDRQDLEPGDHLLAWGDDREVPRYCHAVSDTEADALARASGLEVADRFECDGPQADRNLYLVLAATARASRTANARRRG